MMGLNLWAAVIVMTIVCMIIVHMIGCMAISGINANAVSLVNLVMVRHFHYSMHNTNLLIRPHCLTTVSLNSGHSVVYTVVLILELVRIRSLVSVL